MSLYGTLETFPLTDLLQWVENSRKTGCLRIEKNALNRSIMVREGLVIGCSSNDPPIMLGQILLARGKVTEEQLRQGLATQEKRGGMLGMILVEMGAVTEQEVKEVIASKTEETLYGLFDWNEGAFQFTENAAVPKNLIEVDLTIKDILLRGLQRFDEMKRIREVFRDRSVILARTGQTLPAELENSRASKAILAVINGERTLEEILLHTRASEYLVTKFLFELHRQGLIEVTGSRPAMEKAECSTPGEHDETALAKELEVAANLLARSENEATLAVLYAARRAYPEARSIRQMITQAEAAYKEEAQQNLPSDHIPVLLTDADSNCEKGLSAEESFLLTMIDGESDIRSILWIAPMRTVEILRTIQKLLDGGIIELREPS